MVIRVGDTKYQLAGMKYNWDKNTFVYPNRVEGIVPCDKEVVREKGKWNVYEDSNSTRRSLVGEISEKESISCKSRWRSMSSVFAMGGASTGVIGGAHHLLAGKVLHLVNAGISKLSATNFFLGHATWVKVVAFVPKFGVGFLKFFATLLLSHPIILGAIGTIFLLGLIFNHIKSKNRFYNFFANRFISLAIATAYAFKVIGRIVLQCLIFPIRLVLGVGRLGYQAIQLIRGKIRAREILVGDESWFSIRRFYDQSRGGGKDLICILKLIKQLNPFNKEFLKAQDRNKNNKRHFYFAFDLSKEKKHQLKFTEEKKYQLKFTKLWDTIISLVSGIGGVRNRYMRKAYDKGFVRVTEDPTTGFFC